MRGPVGAKLKEQQSGKQDTLLLWNPAEDRLYELPKSGGTVRAKKPDELAWSDFGYAEKK